MSKKQRFLYAISSGLLLSLPWYQSFSGIFLWVAFLPLLFIEEYYATTFKNSKKEVFLYASLTFIIWNVTTTWWIVNATLVGFCAAVLVNTFLFSLVFWFYHITRKVAGNFIGRLSFIAYWTAFEYFYLNAEISWPWLNLGNGFANDIKLIQWYECTGALGGTVWVLLINLILFECLRNYLINKNIRNAKNDIALAIVLILLPITISLIRFYTYQEPHDIHNIVIIQPNMDPYNVNISARDQCANLLHLADSSGTSSTGYFLAPETSIEDAIWENSLKHNSSLSSIKKFMNKFPKAEFVFGASTYKNYPVNAPRTATARFNKYSNGWYDSFNTGMQVDTAEKIAIYHKSKLVVGVEKMPYPKALKFLEKIMIKMGGSFASHGTQNSRDVFESANHKVRIAPVICYESVYGEYVTDYIKNGANFIFILTNDGWWGNSPGHRQHLSYARLRAIETRRSIARSANTGISAAINQRGEIITSMEWGRRGTLLARLNTNSYQTFYVRYGDFLGKLAYLVSGCIILIMLWVSIKRKFFCP
jgi:apolipoprotein N-acyltransferase